MKIYKLSDGHGTVGYYTRRELAIKAAEEEYNFDKEVLSEPVAESFQAHWDENCHLGEVDVETEEDE